jgi:hypothetical protein
MRECDVMLGSCFVGARCIKSAHFIDVFGDSMRAFTRALLTHVTDFVGVQCVRARAQYLG